MSQPKYIAAIVGGAVAGAEMAAMLARRGVATVVFEQNARPYGKIEDGLPRWHVKLRQKEYEAINGRLDHPLVHFVPNTKIGRDIDFASFAREWGFSLVILAHGAWRDRSLPIDGADGYIGRGLTYQNSFIYWFNHYEESTYDGAPYGVRAGTVVVGGGLASIDVAKALQIEVARQALRERGVEMSVEQLELKGIPDALAEIHLTWTDLGLEPTTIYYRRRIEDMPLLEVPPGADATRRAKVEATRRRLVEKAMRRFIFDVRPLRRPGGMIVSGDRLAGLRFEGTKVVDGKVLPGDGQGEDVHGPDFISSIGSLAEPIRGIPQVGELYDFIDWDLGCLRGYERVFSIGNVVTGRGNIMVSRKHSIETAEYLIEQFLGLGDGTHDGEEDLLDSAAACGRRAKEKLIQWLGDQPVTSSEQIEGVLERVRARQKEVGFDGSYRDWIAKVTPPDMA